ncbi:amine oxidase catalytic domain-containing protein [Phanerochaete sordida]|uniref:Amine oxidase n=1 Tax=Phanerochaete sordida TaxID=48140 RepID=A0A9P3GGS2_9APHY|nr:amine oxidase catalytic domain-containing protein [Phanerochaete sordida]
MRAGYELLKDPSEQPAPPARRSGRRVVWAVLLSSAILVSSLYLFAPNLPSHGDSTCQLQSTPATEAATVPEEPLEQCVASGPKAAKPPAPVNIWSSLTVNDTTTIYRWLNEPSHDLNLTSPESAALSDNFIYHIEAYRPSKSDALRYLESPEDSNLPERYARATIHHGTVPVIKDYLVGPLPVSENTTMRQLTEIYHREDIPFNARGFAFPSEFTPMLMTYMPKIASVTQDLFDGVAMGLPNDTLVAGAVGPLSFDGSFRRTWVNWRRNVPGPWLHPVNFFQYVDLSGNDPAEWKLLKVVYNHQVFPTLNAFLAAYHNGTLRRLPPRPDQDDTDWSARYRPKGPPRDLDDLPGPRQVSFAGLRFRVDRAAQYVSWLGWGVYLGFDRDMGLSLWDVRFLGERIAYEISPQDALAQYAGNDPMQTSTAWLDRFFGMGTSVRDMLPGYDCPYEAVYLPATTYAPFGSIHRERAICIFEHDTGRPITRHTGWEKGEFGAVRGYVLTIRSISTVGNYDYLFDYIFHTDGTIEVRVSASGYLQGGFWEPAQEGYGTAIRDTTMGSLHDHVMNFKVDLDVAGTANSLLYTHTDTEEVERDWFDDDWGTTVVQQKITREYIANEDAARLKYPLNFQGGYAFVNQDRTNRWGIPRGYAIHPGYSPVHNTVVGSRRLLKNADWARYNLAVSRRKDAEPSSSSMWNMNLPGAPPVEFARFFDGEDLAQQDLVAWVNVGMHHLPQAEDAPNTRTNVAASSFFVAPLNYFDADVSMDGANAVLLAPPAAPGAPWTWDDYGVRPAHCAPRPVPPFAYAGERFSGLDGAPRAPASAEEMRRGAEGYHRIKLAM